MKKATLKDVARAVFWLQFNFDSRCAFCNETIERDRRSIIVLRHLRLEHPDIAYVEEEF